MSNRYSIADARNQLARLVHEAEDGSLIELTRRGKPVAVVMSLDEYRRITTDRPSPWQAISSYRQSHDRTGVDVDELLERPSDSGRDFSW